MFTTYQLCRISSIHRISQAEWHLSQAKSYPLSDCQWDTHGPSRLADSKAQDKEDKCWAPSELLNYMLPNMSMMNNMMSASLWARAQETPNTFSRRQEKPMVSWCLLHQMTMVFHKFPLKFLQWIPVAVQPADPPGRHGRRMKCLVLLPVSRVQSACIWMFLRDLLRAYMYSKAQKDRKPTCNYDN